MIDADLKSVAATLSAAISRRVDLSDCEDMAQLVDQHLHVRVLHNYREQLEGMEGAEAFAWLLYRMAEIETRVLALQAAVIACSASPEATPASEQMARPANQDFAQPTSARILFGKELVETGFYAPETGPDGSIFRWIGPLPQASVFIPKMRLPVEVVIKVYAAFLPEVVDGIRVALDGGDWARATVETIGNGYLLKARPQAKPFSHAGTMRLDIDAVRTGSPSDRGEQDARDLAIAISKIEISSI
jgi:hypothetical protein